ncbi:MAG TPA: hypothetical protein VGZ02_10525 [Candidatus Baltobacteraceae bacterium]|nr:hypothetical protein [Candidatus Baltobacteraceae bacterium]
MSLIRIELSSDQRKVEHLISYSNSLLDQSWNYDGDVVAKKGTREITVCGHASWAQHNGECILESDSPFGHSLMSNGSFGTFLPDEEYAKLSGADGSWRSDKAYVSNISRPMDGPESVTLRLVKLATGNLHAVTSSSGLIFAGADLADWPMAFPKGNDGAGFAVDGMVTTIFGRDALIRRMPTKTEAGYDVLVAFDGERLELIQQSALWIVMSFLAGRRANVVGSVGINGDQEVWRERHMWSAPLHESHPPLDPRRWNNSVFDLPKRFPSMVDKALELLNEDIPIDVSLEHLFADSRRQLDVEIRDIVLALDALVECDAFAAGGATLIDPKEYATLLPTLKVAIDEALKGHQHHDALLTRLVDRIKHANHVSHGERRRNFWARVGFELKPDEKAALDNRHPMSHTGYVLRRADPAKYQELSNQVRLARNLVNRVIFALLGYDGPVLDYTSGRMEPWGFFIERDGSRRKRNAAGSEDPAATPG